MTEADPGPLDPFAEPSELPLLEDPATSERIDEMLREYQVGDLLGGWVLVSEWIDERGEHLVAWNVSPGLDWPKCLGLIEAGRARMRQEYLEPTDDDE